MLAPASGRPKRRSRRASAASHAGRYRAGASANVNPNSTTLPTTRDQARLQAPNPAEAITTATTVVTTKDTVSAMSLRSCRNSRWMQAEGVADRPAITSDRASTRIGPAAAGAPRACASHGARSAMSAARPAPEATDTVVTTGAMRSTSSRSAAWTMATLTPSSLMLTTTDSTTSAAANTPNSDGAINRARTIPTNSWPTRPTTVLTVLQARPLPTLDPSVSDPALMAALSLALHLPAQRAQPGAHPVRGTRHEQRREPDRAAAEPAADRQAVPLRHAPHVGAGVAGEGHERVDVDVGLAAPVEGPAGLPQGLGGEGAAHPAPVPVDVLHVGALGEERVEGGLAVVEVDQRVGVRAAQHAAGVDPVDGLGRAPHVADVGHGGDAQPQLEVAGVGQRRLVAADRLVDRAPHHHLGRGDAVVATARPLVDPPGAGPHGGAPPPALRRGERPVGRGVEGPAVHHADARVGLHDAGGPAQRPGRQQVVGRDQHDVVAVGPGQALVVGGDVALVDLVPADGDPGLVGRQAGGHRRGVVGRAVVDDQHRHVHALLVEDAAQAAGQELGVVVARDDDAHGRPPGAPDPPRPD